MNDFDTLRGLLLHQEKAAISELEHTLATLLKETRDPDLIIEKLTPLFNGLMHHTIENERVQFLETFSPIISDLLKETIQGSTDDIAKVMAPIMGDAIKEQVRTQKDTIVDALYPVMGNMISKYVSGALKDTLDEINAKVQNSFSSTAVKRKIKARIKGVSESELLFQEVHAGEIQTLFLIHKASGLLILQENRNAKIIVEADMVSSMLSAIRSFVNEWIAQSDDTFELNAIDYGDSKIYLEVSGCCYLALMVRGEIRSEMRQNITKVLSEVVEKYGDTISKFNGDTSTLPLGEISSKMKPFFELEDTKVSSPSSSKGLMIVLMMSALLILGAFGYTQYLSYIEEKQEQNILQAFYHTPELNLYRLSVDVNEKEALLEGTVPHERLRIIAESIVEKEEPDLKIDNRIVLTVPVVTPETVYQLLEMLTKVYNSYNSIHVAFNYTNEIVTLKGEVPNSIKFEEMIKYYSEIVGVNKLIIEMRIKPPEINQNITYDIAQSTLNTSQQEIIDLLVKNFDLKNMSTLYEGYRLKLTGYADSSGSLEKNRHLAHKRAENVKHYFVSLGVNNEHVFIDKEMILKSDGRKARAVKIVWEKIDD
ncbi:MAG: hypothetical protein DRG24_03030 [Epsilonproteobacteria bacterium]|nr:MAG: hypothetical protein DRG24_03030 [Campylobacterota bacterium]